MRLLRIDGLVSTVQQEVIQTTLLTPARTLFISGLKSRVLKSPFFDGKKWTRLFILKFTEPLQSCCCPVQKYLPRMAKLAWQLSRYLWRGSVNFKINSRPLFTIIFKLKNYNFKTWDFSPLIERVLAGVKHWMFDLMNKLLFHKNKSDGMDKYRNINTYIALSLGLKTKSTTGQVVSVHKISLMIW